MGMEMGSLIYNGFANIIFGVATPVDEFLDSFTIYSGALLQRHGAFMCPQLQTISTSTPATPTSTPTTTSITRLPPQHATPPHALGYINLDTGTKVSLSLIASAFSIVKVFATQHCP
jgi:hypothetical protein